MKKQEIKNDLLAVYYEISEAILTNDILEKNERLGNALYWLKKYVDPKSELMSI